MRKRAVILGLTGVFLTIVVWSVATGFSLISPLFAPSPWDVMYAIIPNFQGLASNTYASLLRLAEGFALGTVIGILVGMALGSSRMLDEVMRPIVDLFRSIPNMAWVPVALIWFGIGPSSEVFVVFLAVFFIVFTNTYQGVKTVNPLLVRAARSLGAGSATILFRIRFNAALGDVFIGLKLGLQAGIVAMVATEVLASTAGLGFMMSQASEFFKSQVVVLVMLELGAIGWLSTQAFSMIQKRYMRWHMAIATR